MKHTLLFFFLAFAGSLFSQQTGSFSIDVDFNEVDYDYDRKLYVHVPADYDEANAYPLVVGFRGGPHSNAGQFRDQLEFLADSLGAIILCPENNDHFNVDEGEVKQLFNYSVDTLASMYSIDRDFIYLTGLSFGGRHAVIVAMDTDAGEIPAIRGLIPFAAGSNSHLQPDYEAIEEFAPACICIGLSDNQVFIDVSNSLHDDITANQGTSILNEIPNVGHTVVFADYPKEMMECINFIEDQYITSTIALEKSEWIVFPNPGNDRIQFRSDNSISIDHCIIRDIQGKILSHVIPNSNSIDVSDIPLGHILIEIFDANQSLGVIQWIKS